MYRMGMFLIIPDPTVVFSLSLSLSLYFLSFFLSPSVCLREEAVGWAAHLGFRDKFHEDGALEIELDSTSQTIENYVYRSRRAIAWGLRTPDRVDDYRQMLEFSIGCPERDLPGRYVELQWNLEMSDSSDSISSRLT